MAKAIGGLWLDVSDLDTSRIHRMLFAGSGTFTVAVPPGTLSRGRTVYALISATPGRISFVGLVAASHRASDLERKVQVGPVVGLNPEIAVDKLLAAVPQRLRRYVIPPTRRVWQLPPATWLAVRSALLTLGNVDAPAFDFLEEVLESRARDITFRTSPNVALERDAFATAFELFNGGTARKAYISSAATSDDAPFIQALKHRDIEPLEDSMIQHDMLTFPGVRSILPDLVGAIKLFTPAGTLTVFNANRNKVEHALGVDLLYYNHSRKSFVMVQYKRMTGKSQQIYRPDAKLEEQVRRMEAFEAQRSAPALTYDGFRMLDCPFYLKLCVTRGTSGWNGRMLPGMYFPLELWRLLLKSEKPLGPRGGVAVGFEQAPRRLSNSDFTRLLKQGWIGTTGCETERINELVVGQLSDDRSVINVIHEPELARRDFLRDDWGRFAEDDDDFAI